MNGMDLLFGKPREISFLDIQFDFELSPEHFMKWLELDGEEVTGDYKWDCNSMCEYACLFVAMLFHDKKLKGELKIYYGKFGFWEHYWIGYLIDGQEYFIDLTLKQFIEDAPELAITKATNERVSGSYSYLSDGETLKEYIEQQRAFQFYCDPVTMTKPPIDLRYKTEIPEHLLK